MPLTQIVATDRRLTTCRMRKVAPEVAVLVSTFEKPDHLRRVLVSLAMQERVGGAMEVVVTDDGSGDQTREVVEAFAREVSFPIRFTTHPHAGFQLARCRNDGVRASRAGYLLFLDGDCIVPRDHVRAHLDHRRDGWVMGGYCCRLDRDISDRITEAAICEDAYRHWVPRREFKRLAKRHRKALFYNLIRHRGKPKLAGGNIGIWRDDYERVNGYDENFVGWGGEDDDLRRRLAATGVRIGSILRWTNTYHLWHPPAPTAAASYWRGVNVHYLHRPGRLVRCRHGLVERPLGDISIGVVGAPADTVAARRFLSKHAPHAADRRDSGPAEVELLFAPGEGGFSGQAQCNVLIVLEPANLRRLAASRWRPAARRPPLVLCDEPSLFSPRQCTIFGAADAGKLFDAIG